MADKKIYNIVVDVMGSDCGIEIITRGGLDAARKNSEELSVIFVGREDEINKVLDSIDDLPKNISVVHAPDEISMSLSAIDGIRMRKSSVSVGLRLVKEGKAEGFISPGNTGAVMGTALTTLGRIPGVIRPAIVAMMPTSTGRPTVLLDVGANSEGKPAHLAQFAQMAAVYAAQILKNEYPRVGLLSIGEERSKGNDLIIEANRMLNETNINFVGNVEGRDILTGTVDVVVTDGFTGNIILKFAESIQPLLIKSVQRQIQTNIFSRIGAMLLLPFLRRMKNTFDYAEAGGAPMLGVNGALIICHGSSNSKAICNAVSLAHKMALNEIKERIRDALNNNQYGQDHGKN